MAEWFFKKEVQKLYLGERENFRGEGIFAGIQCPPCVNEAAHRGTL